ncbi:MAG: conjugal transfer protein TraF [candidate division Zixibacteria bacterium]|nr:conjugal transfer protein TraF [candidate division Zixibacteria bacterium]
MKTKLFIGTLSLILLIPQQLFASGLSSGRSVGMGGAYTQIAKGVESAFWNPANLGLSKNSERSWMIFSLGINANNNSFNLKQYNQYNGKFLTSEDKQTILNSIPKEGFNLSLDADVLALGISEGRYAFAISGRVTSDLLFPKDPLDVLFFGNEINDTILLSGSNGEAYAAMDIRLSHGRSVLKKGNSEISCGISARYVRGLIYQKVNQAEGELFTLETGVSGEGNFLVQSASGGRGYGLDFGLALKYKDNWTFGLSLFNLINRIKWNKKTEKKVYQVQIDSVLAEHFDADSMIIEESYTEDIDPFTTRVPTLMHMGVAYQGKRYLLAFDLKQGFKEGMGVSKKLRASLGAEYKVLSWLDVRGGISVGGNEGVTVANGLGLNLGTYHLDVGIANQKGLWPTNSKGVSLAISNGFRF